MIRIVAFAVALFLMVSTAEARRVALVIGQNAYVELTSLDNPIPDARSMAELLAKHGFDMIACGGTPPGCFDLNRDQLRSAMKELKERAAGADLALVFYAGHGTATEQGNIVAPIDADVDCATGEVTKGVLLEELMAATEPARHKLIILDACRDNPLRNICPSLKGKKLSFTRIEAGAMQGFLLVTSTQFGQEALDGTGDHSPFATALLSALAANPGIYFEQVFNEVARATYAAAQKQDGFLQIPGKVVGGEAPADCLAGKDCVGDARMAALEIENRALTTDASGVRNLIAAEEQARSKPYTPEERQKRVAELSSTLARIGTSTDPLDQEGRRLISQGDLTGGQAKLEEALDADEKAITESERLAAERRKKAAGRARDLAILARGADILKAVAHYQRATRLEPSDPETWNDYARAVLDAGRTKEAKSAFEEAVQAAEKANKPSSRYWARLGLGDVAVAQGDLPGARKFYEEAVAVAEPIAKADPGNAVWQRDLSVSQERIGDVLREEGNLPGSLESYRATLAIAERLAKADPGNAVWQRDLSVSHEKIGDVLQEQGNLPGSLESYRASLAIRERQAKADPGNAGWQHDLSVSQAKIGDVLRDQGNLPGSLESYRASHAIFERLAKADPGNAGWQHDLGISHEGIGAVLQAQGNLPGALKEFEAKREIISRLAKADPGNAGWQIDLSVSQEKIGDVLRDQGNLPGSLESYRASLAIRERLNKADPGNAAWQRDLAISQGRVAVVLERQGERARALNAFRQGRDIIFKLKAAAPSNAVLPGDLAWFDGHIAALEKR